MPTAPQKPRRRPGRPTRQEEVQRALAEIGVDPTLVDPRKIWPPFHQQINAADGQGCGRQGAFVASDQDHPAEGFEAGTDVAARAIN